MNDHDVSDPDPALPDIDTATAHPARIYDFLLGGKDHYPADRKAAEQILAAVPQASAMARANRAFLQRAVRFLAAEAGIGQFLDLGSGLPTHGNVHEVAPGHHARRRPSRPTQAITPDARVCYVDNDPIVHAHGNALLAGEQTTVLFADLREPDRIVGHPKVRGLLDWDRPVAVLLVAVLHFMCAMGRLVVSPAKLGRTRKEVLGSDDLTWSRKVKGTKACQKSGGQAQVSEVARRGTRVIWRKLDCLNSNLQMMKAGIRRKDTRNRRHALCRHGGKGRHTFRGVERCPVRALKEMSGAPTSCCHVRQGRTWDRLRGASPTATECP